MCGDNAEQAILIELVLPDISAGSEGNLLQSFEQKFEQMLFSKILEKETFMTLSNREHNSIIGQLFSSKQLQSFSSNHPQFKDFESLFLTGNKGMKLHLIKRFL